MADPETFPEADRITGANHPRETPQIFGQDNAAATFLDALGSGRMHHAWLLRGPTGVGKATLSYRIARTMIALPTSGGGLFGESGVALPDSLNVPPECPIQARILAQAEPRLFVLRREYDLDKKRLQTQISIDNVRALRHFLGLSAADGGWRVIIVDSADEMNRNSANALLKFLEEPPEKTVFLLISHSPAGLLPTIRSRCRTLDLTPLGPDQMAWALDQAGAEIPLERAGALAMLAGGSVGRALVLSAGDGLDIYARLIAILGDGSRVNRGGLAVLAEHAAGRAAADRYRLILDMIQTLIARLARAAATGSTTAEAAPGEAALIGAVANLPAQGALWADALSRITATTRHAVAVNLDPGQCVIDTMLELDATLDRVRAVAA